MFKTPYTFKFDKNIHAEKNTQKSKTVPDMSYTVRELLEKFTTGSIPNIQQAVQEATEDIEEAYEFDNDLVDVMLAREKTVRIKERLKQQEVQLRKESEKSKKAEVERKPIEVSEPPITDKNVVSTE